MKKKLIYSIVVLLAIIILSGCNAQYQEERYLSEDYIRGMSLEINNSVGDIEIRRWNQDKISVIAIIKGYASSTNEARQIVKSTNISHKWHGNRLVIESNKLSNFINRGRSVSYLISIPERFNLDVNTSTGDIRVDEIQGNVKIDSSTGDIHIDSMFGDIRAKVSTGDIRIGYLEGEIDITTSTGDIKLNLYNKLNTRNSIRTSTGEIDLMFFENPSAYFEIRTSTGDIYYFGRYIDDNIQAGRQGSSSTYNIRTSTGDIYLNHK